MRRSRRVAGPAALLLVLAACGDGPDTSTAPEVTGTGDAAPPAAAGSTGRESPGDPLEDTTAASTGSAEGTPSETAATAETTGAATGAPQGERCLSPLGYSVVVPSGWVTNTGDVAPPCSYLDPEPFTVPPATDLRPAVIGLSVDAVPFAVVSPERPSQTRREETTLAGLDAVRVEAVEDGSGFYAEGTRRTSWYVDLPPVPGEDDPRTLIADAVAAPGDGVDLRDATAVLDRAMATLQLERVTTAAP